MKSLYFIRHAKSSWDTPQLRDHDRPLNKRGHNDALYMSKMLKEKGIKPDKFISSSAKRALSTAQYFASAFGVSHDAIDVEEDIYEAFPDDILDIIHNIPDQFQTVLVFGHNPTFTSMANFFSEDFIANVPTCGIVKVDVFTSKWRDVNESNAQLADFYYPKQFNII
ncbi:MAG TPA: histidine phosphatase family protein [Saprospiraceae bacterium]|nr:histidine phosphatase family protein [Saprospiraceae bacterium]HMQ84252.1 histidine phosphatase family protein [Saprospiraceae bacterium]